MPYAIDVILLNEDDLTSPSFDDFAVFLQPIADHLKLNKEVCIKIVSVDESQYLNNSYRQKDKPTYVLSFPSDIPDFVDSPHLGDLAICADVVSKEAQEQSKMPNDHWAHMTIHGCLHLLGYDHIEEDEAEEMEALDQNDLRQTAIVSSAYKDQLNTVQMGVSTSEVNLTSYHPEKLQYDASIKGGDRLVVFSEIYYNTGNDDWKVQIDGKEAEIFRVNYALRGVVIPEGEHKITMSFEPMSFYVGSKVSGTFSILFILSFLGLIFMSFKQSNATEA